MAHNKFKICPACGERSISSKFECLKCETDLTSVKIVDEAILQSSQKESANTPASVDDGELVKTCDCGTANPPQTRKCISCGEDISDIRPAPLQNTVAPKRYALRSVDGEYMFEFDKPVVVIGREAVMREYLLGKSYVSRQHAKVTVTDGGVFIENISTTNLTFINNIPVSSDAPTLLKSGDEIGIGGKVINGSRQNKAAYFILEVKPRILRGYFIL